jgi:hypothetical protein
MVLLSCDDVNKFLYVGVVIASRIHKFSHCVVVTSA